MQHLNNTVRLLIPSARLNASPELQAAVFLAIMDIGGVTITEGRGQWLNPTSGELMSDHLVIHSFSCTSEDMDTLRLHTYRIADKLIELGEFSVAIEQGAGVLTLLSDRAELARLIADLEVRDATVH